MRATRSRLRTPHGRQRYAGPRVSRPPSLFELRRKLTRATVGAVVSADFMEPCLHAVERGVAATAADQFVVVAVLDDAAALDGDDAVGLAHRGEPVRDDDDGAALRDAAHVVLD